MRYSGLTAVAAPGGTPRPPPTVAPSLRVPARHTTVRREGWRPARVMLFLIVLVSAGNFNPSLLPFQTEFVQQQLAFGLWLGLIAMSFLPGVVRWKVRSNGLLWPGLFLLWAVISPVWSTAPSDGMLKAGALLIVTLATCRVAMMVTIEEFFGCMTYGIAALAGASMVAAVLIPRIGIVHDWQHDGQWVGIYTQKQTLGISCGFLAFLALLRLTRKFTVPDALAFLVGLACLAGSGSRGGGAIAVLAVSSLFAARTLPGIRRALIALIGIEFCLAMVLLAFLAYTGYDYIPLFGQQINITERTFVWQWGISYWTKSPLVGYGLDGFWTDPYILFGFFNIHGWVLDNMHSGYFTIAVENGLIGLTLFAGIVFSLMSRLRRLAGRKNINVTALEVTLGIFVLSFTINFTETFFLRSTSFFSVAFSFLLVKVFATTPHPVLARQRRAGIRPMPAASPLPAAASGVTALGSAAAFRTRFRH